jgi:RNA polymerase sigma-70 factor (ECF subfamily)
VVAVLSPQPNGSHLGSKQWPLERTELPPHEQLHAAAPGDAALVASLRAGDERAFVDLVEQLHPSLVRLARSWVHSPAVAEDVAQETWVGVLRGLDSFESRSSLKTWIFRILVNRAKTRAERESRTISFSDAAGNGDGDRGGPSVDADRFLGSDHPRWPHHWATPPRRWDELPEERLLGAETRALIESEIATLPSTQRQVIELRDVEGLDSDEVCHLLDLTPGNQRVLLHRARSRVRRALERYLEPA